MKGINFTSTGRGVGIVLVLGGAFAAVAGTRAAADTLIVYGGNGGPGQDGGVANAVIGGSSAAYNMTGAYGGNGGGFVNVSGGSAQYMNAGIGGNATAATGDGSSAYTSGLVTSIARAQGGIGGDGGYSAKPNVQAYLGGGSGSAGATAVADNRLGSGTATAVARGGMGWVGIGGNDDTPGTYAAASSSAYAGAGAARASASAYGGNGMEGGPVQSGPGGNATANAVAAAVGANPATVYATAVGGSAYGAGHGSGPYAGPPGGASFGNVFGSSGSGTVNVTGVITGGSAGEGGAYVDGNGFYVPGPTFNGKGEMLHNGIGGTTSGVLNLTQQVSGGYGSGVSSWNGSSSYTTGSGGYAESYLSVSQSCTSLNIQTIAAAGAAGGTDGAGTPGNAGAGTADSEARNSSGTASATANATGGTAGFTTSAIGLAGGALATATATSSGAGATANAEATGGAGAYFGNGGVGGVGGDAQALASAAGATSADAVAKANGGSGGYIQGYGGGAGSAAAGAYAAVTGDPSVGLVVSQQTVQALGGSAVSGTVVAVAYAHASVGGTIPAAAGVAGDQLVGYATTSPGAGAVSSATSNNASVSSVFNSPNTKALGMFTVLAGAPNLGTPGGPLSETLKWTVAGSAVGSNENLMFGFFGPASNGTGAVTFDATVNGASGISESFGSFSAASTWFNDNVVNLGTVAAGQALAIDVTFAVTPAGPGNYFGTSGIFGLEGPLQNGPAFAMRSFAATPVPEPSTLGLLAWPAVALLPLLMRAKGRRRQLTRI